MLFTKRNERGPDLRLVQWVTKTGNLLLQNARRDDARFTTLVQTRLCKDRFDVVLKRATSLFNSFCSNVERQVARFLLPV